jgi:hypothetical protein
VNTLNQATFTVNKDFQPNAGGSVNVSLGCTSGTVTTVSGTASEVPPTSASFTVTGFNAGATCTASEAVPSGYTVYQADCVGKPITPGGNATCTLVNNLNQASFTVYKDFSDNNASPVTVSLSCASGTVTPGSASIGEGSPMTFLVTGFDGDPLCSATESPIPAGYVTTQCAAPLSLGSCTIVNIFGTVGPATATPTPGPVGGDVELPVSGDGGSSTPYALLAFVGALAVIAAAGSTAFARRRA